MSSMIPILQMGKLRLTNLQNHGQACPVWLIHRAWSLGADGGEKLASDFPTTPYKHTLNTLLPPPSP